MFGCLSNRIFKAHYQRIYIAVLSNTNDIKQVSRSLWKNVNAYGLAVLGPDVNESYHKFTVNEDYAVRFGMGDN